METNQQPASAPASDSAAETELAKFVKENRQQLPALPERPDMSGRTFTPETETQTAEREAAEAVKAARNLRAEIRGRGADLVNAAGARYRDCTLDSFAVKHPQQQKVVKALREYLASDSIDDVILYGPVGTGKDHLAFSLCRVAIREGRTVKWVNGQAWFGAVRDSMDTERSEASLIKEMTSTDVLCLSDPLPPVGALSQHQSTMLYRVIDGRYSRGLQTICTVNVANDAEGDERMGAATWDRLCHGAWKLHCAWPTYRQPVREV